MGVEVCPVHKAEFKSSDISNIHVGAMSYISQPRGLKRKHPDDDDDDDDEEEEEEEKGGGPPPDPNTRQLRYNERRQEILEFSYEKLSKYKLEKKKEISLRQYVMVCNITRSIETEMERDGIVVGGPTGGPFLPAVNHQIPFDPTRPPPPDDAQATLSNVSDGLSSVTYPTNPYVIDSESRTTTPSVISPSDAPSDSMFGTVNNGTSYSSDYDRYLMDLDGPSSGRVTPFVRSDVESGALWSDDSDRLSSLNWSSVLKIVDGGNSAAVTSYSETAMDSSTANCNFDASSNSSSGCSDCSISDDAMSSSETSLHMLMPATIGIPTGLNSVSVSSTTSSVGPNVNSASGSTSPESGSSPSSSEDEIFGDIDLALYDYDFTPLSPPNVRMAPVSAEELMQSLSSDQKPENFVPSNGYYKKEYCSDDREHLTFVHT